MAPKTVSDIVSFPYKKEIKLLKYCRYTPKTLEFVLGTQYNSAPFN